MKFSSINYPSTGDVIYKGEHKSGMKIFVLPREGFTKSYAVLATRYGSVNQKFKAPGDTSITTVPDGIAHYLEHKMFDQSDGSSVFDRFAMHGANANAFTSFTITAYLFSSSSDFYENLETLFDYTMHPYYTDETVSKEQGIIGQEIRMYEDEPDWNVYFNALTAMYSENHVATDIAGTVESIAEITKEKLYKCYNTFYHPSNMVLFCTGNVDAEKVGEYAERFIPAESDPGEITNYFPEEPEKINKPLIEAYFDIGTPQFAVAFKDNLLPGKGDDYVKRDAEMSVLCEIIGGKSSALYNTLYEKGLINESFDIGYEGELTYAFTMLSGESKNPSLVKDEIVASIENLKKDGIDEETFKRAKRVCYGRAISLYDKQETFSNTFIRFAVKDADFMTYPDAVSDVTLEDVTNHLKRFSDKNVVLSAIYPKEGKGQ